MAQPTVSRGQLTFALSVLIAFPLAATSPTTTRALLSRTDAGEYLEKGGSIDTWKLTVHEWAVFGGAVAVFALGVMACHILAGIAHDAAYRSAAAAEPGETR